MAFIDFWKKIEPKKENKFAHATYDALFTFFFKPNLTTSGKGVHIRDAMDLKRTMIFVVIAMQLCYVFGTINIGYQHFLALGVNTGFFDAFHLKLVFGLVQLIPIFVVAHLVGLGIEFYFAARRGHAVEEGFLVSAALIPLIMPPGIPLWMLALSIVFAVILGKEAFGGTGMNVVNVALLARVFIFFAYPTTISGDTPWIAGLDLENKVADYHWGHLMFNPLFESLGWSTFQEGHPLIANFSGATPLAIGYQSGWAVTDPATGEITGGILSQFSALQMWMGGIPGSIGETCKPAIIIGGIILLTTGIASWRIMLSFALGVIVMGLLFNVWQATPYMDVPWYHHFGMGGLLFALVFMATDPVTAAQTNRGKLWYGFLIGVFGMMIRVMNPAYAEGWMLAILIMNVFAPLVDHFVIEGNISKRMKRAKLYAKGS
jgi:Na+-transporting NADH:ubiquinone oxidoreductase subunit B